MNPPFTGRDQSNVQPIAEVLCHEPASTTHQHGVSVDGQRANQFRKFAHDHRIGDLAIDDIIEQLAHLATPLPVQHVEDIALHVQFFRDFVQQFTVVGNPRDGGVAAFVEGLNELLGERQGFAAKFARDRDERVGFQTSFVTEGFDLFPSVNVSGNS